MIAKVNFEASQVNCQETDGVLLVGFANDSGQYILLQRSMSPTDQDRQLGQDHVHIEMNDQRHATYGGVNGYTLSREKLTIQLSTLAAQKIESKSTLDINFKIDQGAFDVLKTNLLHILGEEQSATV